MNPNIVFHLFCEEEPMLPLFMQAGWMNALCGKNTEGVQNWSCVLACDEKDAIEGVLVFQIRKKWGFTTLSEPPLSPFCGIWLRPKTFKKQHEHYHFVKKTLAALIEQLPKAHRYQFRFHYNLTDWQPFYWAGWQQTTRYTYVLNLIENADFFQNYNTNTQRNCRKADRIFTYTLAAADDHTAFAKFLKINQLTYKRQGLKPAFFNAQFEKADTYLSEQSACWLFFAKNTEGVVCAAMYVALDKNNSTAYYLGGGATDFGRDNGAMHGLMHHILTYSQQQGFEKFDFEGSMLVGVEAFFRGFGGRLMSYFQVKKAHWVFKLF
jgi:hypothetical protein